MLGYILRRLLLGVLIIATVSFASFLLVNSAGDLATALAGEDALDEEIEAIRQAYGLDRPFLVRYAEWAGNAFRGDFGDSLYFPLPAMDLIIGRLPVTIGLAVASLVLALLIGVPLGVIAAANQGGWVDTFARGVATLGQATPTFFMALLLILLLGVQMRLLPISGNDTVLHFVMPVIVLTVFSIPPFLRLTRSTMIDVMRQDYMRTAEAKGLSRMQAVFRHGMRNALLPVVSLAAVQFGNLLEGSIVIETIFALDGIGMLAWNSVIRLDFVVIQALVFWASLVYVVLTIGSDILNAWLNPRLRVG